MRMLQAAQRYADKGWAVFPCKPGEKVPATKHGVKDATKDPGQIARWWHRMPDANIGVACGQPSGIVVVDLDGDEGRDTAIDWIAQGRSFKALWQKTPSGGWHAVFQMPGREIPNSSRSLGPGVDVRGDGGYIVVAPSVHPNGGRYRWPDSHRIPAAPGWLLGMIHVLPPDTPQFKPGTVDADVYTKAAVESVVNDITSAVEGTRNHTLNAAAYSLGRLVGAGYLTDDDVWTVLQPAAHAVGLTARETRATIQSGLRSGKQEPHRL